MLNAIYQKHKKDVLIAGNGFAVDCVLKPYATAEGYSLKGISHFTGVTFDEKGEGYFGDSFDITLDVNDVKKYTQQTPVRGWYIQVTFPQYNNDVVEFCIENVAIDRTLGMYLLRCSAKTDAGDGKRFNRNNAGGI
ncbi:MAG: hypothetical protein J5606_00530 [Bacteroidales bacterium]|jgi:hypothetical protein|nr:hypothetical protein [Bacteroidales bacterium]